MTPATTKNPSQLLTEALASETPPSEIARTLREALTATTTTRAGTVEPDFRTRLQACDLAIRFSVGLPVQRTEAVSVNLDADSAVGMRERLQNSPALRQVFRRVLDDIDHAAARDV